MEDPNNVYNILKDIETTENQTENAEEWGTQTMTDEDIMELGVVLHHEQGEQSEKFPRKRFFFMKIINKDIFIQIISLCMCG